MTILPRGATAGLVLLTRIAESRLHVRALVKCIFLPGPSEAGIEPKIPGFACTHGELALHVFLATMRHQATDLPVGIVAETILVKPICFFFCNALTYNY